MRIFELLSVACIVLLSVVVLVHREDGSAPASSKASTERTQSAGTASTGTAATGTASAERVAAGRVVAETADMDRVAQAPAAPHETMPQGSPRGNAHSGQPAPASAVDWSLDVGAAMARARTKGRLVLMYVGAGGDT